MSYSRPLLPLPCSQSKEYYNSSKSYNVTRKSPQRGHTHSHLPGLAITNARVSPLVPISRRSRVRRRHPLSVKGTSRLRRQGLEGFVHGRHATRDRRVLVMMSCLMESVLMIMLEGGIIGPGKVGIGNDGSVEGSCMWCLVHSDTGSAQKCKRTHVVLRGIASRPNDPTLVSLLRLPSAAHLCRDVLVAASEHSQKGLGGDKDDVGD
jgi:hypothetical protein